MSTSSGEEKRILQVSGTPVTYYIRFKDGQKNIILRVKEGDIHLSAPTYTPEEQIDSLIRKHYQKITKLQTNFEINNKYDFYTSKPWIKIFDKKVPIHIVEENINTKATKDGFYMKNYNDNDEQLKKLYSFLSKYYKNWFIQETLMWANKMGLEFKSITVKPMKGKWGACYTKEEKIIFNTRLLHFSKEVIDSVIVHELAHLVNPNHSKQFYNLVERTMPNYKQLAKILDTAGM